MGQAVGQPRRQPRDFWSFGCARPLVAIDPAGDLALHVAFGMSDGVETGRAPVERVQLHQHSNQRFGDGPMKVGIRLPIQREILIQHQAAAALHHVELCADHLHVLAQDKWLWSEWEARVEALEDVELARHVVRPWRHRTERRPPQHRLPVARAEQIRQVGVAGWELLHLDRFGIEPAEPALNEEFRNPRDGETFVGANWNRINHRRGEDILGQVVGVIASASASTARWPTPSDV